MENKCYLKDIAHIYTTKAFLDIVSSLDSDNVQRYIYIPKRFTFGKSCFFENKSLPKDDGFIVVAKNGIELQYLAFLLNSLIAALYFCKGNLSRTASINKKLLGELPVKKVDPNRMKSMGVCQRIIFVLLLNIDKRGKKDSLQFYYDLYTEIRDGMSLELLLTPLFEKFQIKIIEEWEKILVDSELKIRKITEELLKDNNELMNQVRKMRILITNIGKLVQDNNDAYELED